jgi:hypothetical protein
VPYVLLFPLSLSLVATATAQTPPDSQDTRPATPTTSGDTGFWTVPTGEVLPLKQWSASLSRLEANGGQGFLNMSTFPLTFAVGLGHRTEVFGSWHTVTRLDRDSRPLFFPASSAEGTGGGIDVDYPLTRTTFTGSKRGDLWLGAKLALLPARANRSLALAVRPMVKLPVGDKDAGTSSGKADFSTDVVVSTEAARFLELSGYGGMQLRGNPDGFALTHGIRWGVGAGLPSRLPLRMTVEVYGERTDGLHGDRWVSGAGVHTPRKSCLPQPGRHAPAAGRVLRGRRRELEPDDGLAQRRRTRVQQTHVRRR